MAIVRFLDVGCADTTILESSGKTLLIDCDSAISNYFNLLPENRNIHAVFITHQHYDHFLGLEYLKDHNYTIDYLISSPYSRRNGDNSVELDEWNKYNELENYFSSNGTKVYKPYRQDSFEKPWWETAGLSVWIIGPEQQIATKATRELHDASLVISIIGNRRFCFAGDASDESLNWIAANTSDFCNDVLHASHHGSINGADLDFIKKASIAHTIISTKSGVHDNVPHTTALSRYNTHSRVEVLRTDLRGTITWQF